MFSDIFKDPQALGQVVGAVIGVVGLFIGTFVTIITTFFIRSMDLKREHAREKAEQEKTKKEKEFNLKREIYSAFLSELAYLENFLTKKIETGAGLKNMQNFDDEWTRIEIKVDLVAGEKVRNLKEKLQIELLALAGKRYEGKSVELTAEYLKDRSELLASIREDIDIFPA